MWSINSHAIYSRFHHPGTETLKFLSEKLWQFGSADNQSHTRSASTSSTCATMQAHIDQYLHELRATLPEEDAITFRSRQQAAYPLLAPLAQDLRAVPASQAYMEHVFSVCGWLIAGHGNRLSKNLEMRVFLKLNKDLV